MKLTDKLVFYATMGQTNPPWTQTDYVGGNNLTAPNAASVADGPSIHLTESLKQSLQHVYAGAFDLVKPFTLAIKVRFTTLNDNAMGQHVIASSCMYAAKEAGSWYVHTGFTGDIVYHPTVLQVGVWYQLVFSWDGGTARLWVDTTAPKLVFANAGFVPVNQSYISIGDLVPSPFNLHGPLDGDVRDLYIWKRALTEDEVSQINAGEAYPFTVEDDCKAVICCPTDPTPPYNASNPSPSGTANTADACFPTPTIDIEPPSGTTVTFPTFVFLTASRPDAVIHYTTDGTAPTIASPIYTAPFQITSPGQLIQAFAVVEGCSPGPLASAQYVQFSSAIFKFGYSCDTTDKMGQWGQFAPNGVADYHWTLQLKFLASTVIKRIELYQTNAIGFWNSGQAWSTDEFINPKEGPPGFHVFPLGIFDDNLNPNVAFAFTHQLNVAYAATFTTAAAQQYLWTLIGQPNAPLNGYFKLLVFLGDGTKMESIINTTCGDPPPPCPGPKPPTLTPTCSGIDVTFTTNVDGSSIIGKNFSILRAVLGPCGDGIYRTLTTGVVATNPQTVSDTGLTDGCTYCYELSVDEGTCGVQVSTSVCGQPLCLPKATITAVAAPGCYPVQVTVNWSTSCTTGNIIVDEISLCAGTVNRYTGAGNGSGSYSGTINCDTCFKITYGNACLANQTKQACIIIAPASCTPPLPSLLTVQGWNDSTFFDLLPCSSGDTGPCAFSPAIPSWTGLIPFNIGCTYNGGAGTGLFFPPSSPGAGLKAQFASVGVSFDGAKWLLGITVIQCQGVSQSGDLDVWEGSKECGSGPLGDYTKTGGCAPGPATITLV